MCHLFRDSLKSKKWPRKTNLARNSGAFLDEATQEKCDDNGERGYASIVSHSFVELADALNPCVHFALTKCCVAGAEKHLCFCGICFVAGSKHGFFLRFSVLLSGL
ncbi:MAG TPA: hypothetical protein VJH33_04015 [Candidatus Paceibacterota bacterium]